jgi:hypothetical protein
MILGRVRPEVVHLVDGTSYRLGHWCDPSTWSLVPRRFATAASAGWVRRYSLSNKTFSLVDEFFHQFSFASAMSLPGVRGRDMQKGLVEQYAELYKRTAMRMTAWSKLAVLAHQTSMYACMPAVIRDQIVWSGLRA